MVRDRRCEASLEWVWAMVDIGVGRPDLRGRRQGILMDSSAMALMDWRSIMNVAHSGTNSPYSLCLRSTGTDRGDEWMAWAAREQMATCKVADVLENAASPDPAGMC
ncbi:hypothetical protein FOIG_00683 [Fusarium odoratissimum NRRL 54006]|uniref:Uncharacterized protein n=1 Tax=Fusarium odoratissimum (strain NRRL 54006) TaxID=1089451 RepID=X0KB19_FUSO5|nr:uncharacterized protein FOIG_00683 [Fusarium odoratissimum NRRL 54006]EXM10703.1 hypothetical protein FOIG_00683 [Fusarium odoratissimum NRRL 54006]